MKLVLFLPPKDTMPCGKVAVVRPEHPPFIWGGSVAA
jgi:hypothetical protein